MFPTEASGHTSNPTVLIVEDHSMVRRSLREWLSASLTDCQFLDVGSGEEALIHFAPSGTPPCLVLMDIGLPGMNGIEATKRIRALAPDTQVVVLTIHEDPAYEADADAVGAAALVHKRTMQKDLLPVLRQLLA